MKYIEKSRLETFLKEKGYKVNSSETTSEELTKASSSWTNSDKNRVAVPTKDVLQSNELPRIFNDIDLLEEFRRF